MQVVFYKVYVAFIWLFFRDIIDLNCFILNKNWRERVGIEPTLPAFGRQHRL